MRDTMLNERTRILNKIEQDVRMNIKTFFPEIQYDQGQFMEIDDIVRRYMRYWESQFYELEKLGVFQELRRLELAGAHDFVERIKKGELDFNGNPPKKGA